MKSSSPGKGSTWFRRTRRVEHVVYSVEKAICGASLFVMLFATAFTVVARNLKLSWPNYGELGLAALIPLTLVGGAMCTYLGSHIAVELAQAVPSRRLKNFCHFAVAVATIAFAAIYAYSGVVLVDEFLLTGDKMLDLDTPYWILALFFPIGMGLMIFHALMQILAILTGHSLNAEAEAAR
ncbi:TRAP transporter small permease [Aromatoleum evansii]|uniref:TRAP transporter small permease protein n=1 Tax=Aromatoleum evansii TaxID=59406 RepID=A0ABZ1AGL0_AROEV|nr:TRAP transporter small permease subunit [Aromatoleum evansii]NMG29801.1 TRAP transporter small permease subunit [Aromatoleum evansii]WRL44873.1 TRAP transporter small permease subunit [Aromatoleum evansii]